MTVITHSVIAHAIQHDEYAFASLPLLNLTNGTCQTQCEADAEKELIRQDPGSPDYDDIANHIL